MFRLFLHIFSEGDATASSLICFFSRNEALSLISTVGLRKNRMQETGGKKSRAGELKMAQADSSHFSAHMDVAENML